MLMLRKSHERGHFNHGWLDTYHSFSFGEYQDPAHMGFSVLRVINEDWVQAGKGFPTHPHRDMEILTYVLEGALAHQDSMGNGTTIRPGEVQRMSAGSGITHSEYNASPEETVHLLQIWIHPERAGLTPSYEQKSFSTAEKRDRLCLIAAPEGQNGAVTLHQDAWVYATVLQNGAAVSQALAPNRCAYIHLARGTAKVNGVLMEAGDGAGLTGETTITLEGQDGAEALWFDLPA